MAMATLGERQKPFVAYMDPRDLVEMPVGRGPRSCGLLRSPNGGYNVPVLVVHLLPDDPKPGEEWLTDEHSPRPGERVEILSPVWGNGFVRARFVKPPQEWEDYHVSRLRRPPVLKTFRLPLFVAPMTVRYRDGHSSAECIEIDAESKEAAVAKLADMLREVP